MEEEISVSDLVKRYWGRGQKVGWISNTISLVLFPKKMRLKTHPTVKALFNCSPSPLEKGEELDIINI